MRGRHRYFCSTCTPTSLLAVAGRTSCRTSLSRSTARPSSPARARWLASSRAIDTRPAAAWCVVPPPRLTSCCMHACWCVCVSVCASQVDAYRVTGLTPGLYTVRYYVANLYVGACARVCMCVYVRASAWFWACVRVHVHGRACACAALNKQAHQRMLAGTSTVGARVYDILLQGRTVYSEFDAVAIAGDHTGACACQRWPALRRLPPSQTA